MKDFKKLEKDLNISFKNKDLLTQAFATALISMKILILIFLTMKD